MIAKPREHRDPWRFIALARAKHIAKRPSRSAALRRPASHGRGVGDWLTPWTCGSVIFCRRRVVGAAIQDKQRLIVPESRTQPSLGCRAGRVDHAPLFAEGIAGATPKEEHDEECGVHA